MRPDLGLIRSAAVMTLDKRLSAGELGNASAEMASWGIPVRRLLVGDGVLFPAREYHWVDVDASPRRQAFNYASALLKFVSECGQEGPVLYLEDDAEMVPVWEAILPKAVEELRRKVGSSYDVFHLGGNHVNGRVWKYGDHLLRAEYSLDLHAVVLSPRCFDRLKRIVPSSHSTIDGVLGEMQRRGELAVYGVNPPVAYQKPMYSHNERKYDDKTDRHLVRYW